MKLNKKLLIGVLLACCGVLGLFAQTPDPSLIGVDTAQQMLLEVSVSKFEDAGFWSAEMPLNEGFISVRQFTGSPQDKDQVQGEYSVGVDETDENVLGVKVEYLHRGMSSFSLTPLRPLPIEGITKTISVWVCGRNVPHELYVNIKDRFGQRAELYMGTLNFSGWKQLTVAVPSYIIQRDSHYNNRNGISVTGFRVACDLEETYGSYYMYLDGLTAITDLFAEENRDTDDMQDVW